MTETVIVTDMPGYRAFLAVPLPGLGSLPAVDGRGDLAVVLVGEEPVVVPAEAVRPLTEDERARIRGARLYRREWAVKRHCSEREIYVPAAIRPHTVPEEAW